jgi:lysophospholipase L1-like esterase
MKISEKINLDLQGLIENGPITIVAFGDSVTHGAVAHDEIDYETVYWNRLKKKINNLRNYVPVNVINAGIGGITAKDSLKRMDKQVLSHNPDLIIVCFGLNDVNGTLEDYLNSLEEIFDKAQKSGAEVIFMTPNMLNTSVLDDTAEEHYEYAIKTAKMQNEGRMDLYMESAVQLATRMGVKVCDCYKKWKKLSETQDVTYLLANRINHPTKEMHELFAESLFEIIFEDSNHKERK